MSTQKQQHQLEWPDGYERTNPDDREPYPGDHSVSHRQAFESTVEELERWGKTDVEIETAATHCADKPTRCSFLISKLTVLDVQLVLSYI